MKKVLYLFLLALIFASCSDKIAPEDLGDSSAQIIKGEKTYNFRFDAQSTCNKNCNNLFLHVNYRNQDNERFSIYFYLKDYGSIDKVTYLGEEGIFESTYFDPYKHFTINNFKFDDKTGSLYFEFEGNLYINTLANREPFFLKGKIDIPSLKDIECRNYTTNSLKLVNENTRLLYNRGGSIIENPQTPQKKFRHEFYTDNGFRFTLNSEKNIYELPHGVYPFNEADITNNVNLREFIGKPDVTPSFYYKDWIEYKTVGSYTITGQHKTDEYDTTTGYIDIKAFDNNELKYHFEKVYFEAINIE